jgi:hypothetical protein
MATVSTNAAMSSKHGDYEDRQYQPRHKSQRQTLVACLKLPSQQPALHGITSTTPCCSLAGAWMVTNLNLQVASYEAALPCLLSSYSWAFSAVTHKVLVCTCTTSQHDSVHSVVDAPQ